MAKVFSNEDGNLNRSLRVIKTRQYSDVDLSFAARTVSDGDIYKKTDAAAVKQSIKTLLLTNRFEKPYRPQFGANLGALLFSLADEDTGAEIADRIKKSITRYEPRADILRLEVTATPDFNSVNVTLEFRVVDTNVVDTLELRINETVTAPITSKAAITESVDDPIFSINGAIYISTDTVLSTGDNEILVRT